MGTFHHDKGELHGITVVVDGRDGRTWIGRCDTVAPGGIVLLDGDVHEASADGIGREAWLARAARVGVWKRFDRAVVPTAEVAAVRRLAELRAPPPTGS